MFNNIYFNKKVLITGHTGFKGSWLTIWLNMLGAKVYGISNGYISVPSFMKSINKDLNITEYIFDIKDEKKISKYLNEINPDFIFHLAAQSSVKKSYKNPLQTFNTNIIGTLNILEYLKVKQPKCCSVFITSDKVYKNMEWNWGYKETDTIGGYDPYSASKSCCEFIISSYFESYFKNSNKNKIAIARAGNVIGGGDWSDDRIIPDIIKNWQKKSILIIKNKNATRPWQHVLEPLSGYLLLGQKLFEGKINSGEAYNFGPNNLGHIPVIDLVKNINKFINFKFKLTKSKNRIKETSLLKLNSEKAFMDLEWYTVFDFENIIKFTSFWYLAFYNNKKEIFKFSKQQINKYYEIAKSKKLKWTK